MSSLPLLLCVMLASAPDGGTPDAGPQELARRLRFNEMALPGNMPHLTGLDVDNNVSYSVLLQSNLDGTTTVILGEAYLHARREEPASDLAPLYPGAKGVLQASQETARTISYTVQALPSEVNAFYQKALAAEGLREVEPGIFSGPARTVRMWIQPKPGGQTSVLLLIYPSTPSTSPPADPGE